MPAARMATRRPTSSRPILSRRASRWPRRRKAPGEPVVAAHAGTHTAESFRFAIWRTPFANDHGLWLWSPRSRGRRKELLLLLPERQQALAGGAADHAGDADRHRTERCRRDAAERDRADADLAPEIEIAARVRALRLEFIDRGERILAHGAELHRVGGLDHFGERHLDRVALHLEFAAQIFSQRRIAHGVAGERIARHAADGEFVDGVVALGPGQHRDDAQNRAV